MSYSEAVIVVEQLDKNTGIVTYDDGLKWFKNNFLNLKSWKGKIARVNIYIYILYNIYFIILFLYLYFIYLNSIKENMK